MAKLEEYRCTRRYPYRFPGCAGENDVTARTGYFKFATSVEDAREQMEADFPEDVIWAKAKVPGNVAFDIQPPASHFRPIDPEKLKR